MATEQRELGWYFSVDGGLGDLVQDRSLAGGLAESGGTRGTDASTRVLSVAFARGIFVAFSSDDAGSSVSYRKLFKGRVVNGNENEWT